MWTICCDSNVIYYVVFTFVSIIHHHHHHHHHLLDEQQLQQQHLNDSLSLARSVVLSSITETLTDKSQPPPCRPRDLPSVSYDLDLWPLTSRPPKLIVLCPCHVASTTCANWHQSRFIRCCHAQLCLSVCPSHAGNASKPITAGSCGFYLRVAQGLYWNQLSFPGSQGGTPNPKNSNVGHQYLEKPTYMMQITLVIT